jgi:hypothetical protein
MAGRVRRYAACNDGLENAVRFMVWINRIMLRVAYQNPYPKICRKRSYITHHNIASHILEPTSDGPSICF